MDLPITTPAVTAPSDLEVERFVVAMLEYVEDRKDWMGEQAAIDSFLDSWRGGLNATAASEPESADQATPLGANVIPFPLARVTR